MNSTKVILKTLLTLYLIKRESFHSLNWEIDSEQDKEIVGNFSLDLTLKFQDEPEDILITLTFNDVQVGEKVRINQREFDRHLYLKFYKLQKSSLMEKK